MKPRKNRRLVAKETKRRSTPKHCHLPAPDGSAAATVLWIDAALRRFDQAQTSCRRPRCGPSGRRDIAG